jgi:hypothetical protein
LTRAKEDPKDEHKQCHHGHCRRSKH